MASMYPFSKVNGLLATLPPPFHNHNTNHNLFTPLPATMREREQTAGYIRLAVLSVLMKTFPNIQWTMRAAAGLVWVCFLMLASFPFYLCGIGNTHTHKNIINEVAKYAFSVNNSSGVSRTIKPFQINED